MKLFPNAATMPPALGSTLLLTLLLAVGLVFFLRAASKDRTTVVEVRSSRPPMEVLPALAEWLQQRGWIAEESNPERRLLRFRGQVGASSWLAGDRESTRLNSSHSSVSRMPSSA